MKKVALVFLISCLILLPCWSTKYKDSYIEMDIPDELEIQNDTWDSFVDNFRSDSLDDVISYNIVLQQKGLNDFELEAFDRYCRVMIKAIDTGITGYSNKDFEDEIANCSFEELEGLLDTYEKLLLGSAEVVERYETSSKKFDGKYALYMNLLRKSAVEGRADVHFEGYVFFVNGQMFFVTASYRVDCADLYEPIIEKLIPTIKILLEDSTNNNGALYEQTLPWVSSVKFLWPEEKISWETTTETDGTLKTATFSDVYHLGISCNLVVANSDLAVSKAEQGESLKYLKTNLVNNIKSMFSDYNITFSRNTVSDGKIYIDYKYTVDGASYYGSMYSRFADTKRIIMLGLEQLTYDNSVTASISESLGF